MIIKAAKRKFNSDKMCRSYSDLNFGVTFLEHSVSISPYNARYARPAFLCRRQQPQVARIAGALLDLSRSSGACSLVRHS